MWKGELASSRRFGARIGPEIGRNEHAEHPLKHLEKGRKTRLRDALEALDS
jgi:hypothetical protein